MLEKTIKQVLTKKIDKWIESVEDVDVKKAIKENLIITGGCFTSMIENNHPNDFDCYFKTKEAVIKVAEYYVKQWRSTHPNTKLEVLDCDEILKKAKKNGYDNIYFPYGLNETVDKGRVKIYYKSKGVAGDPEKANSNEELGVESTNDISAEINNMTCVEQIEELDECKVDELLEQEKKEFFPVFISSNAITLSNKIQIVCRFYGEPDKIHQTYDFVHTKAYYDYGTKELSIPREVYETTVNKTLIYTGSKYPVCSLFRLRKFIKRGWKINAGQILKMAMQVSDLDLNNIDVLEDQLIGVDSLYFMDLIEKFRKMKEKDSDFVLTSSYLISIIDKIF